MECIGRGLKKQLLIQTTRIFQFYIERKSHYEESSGSNDG